MRIIAGEKRGSRLQTLEGEDVRPTLERVKEGMFSSVQFLIPGAVVLDLFAGSGQLGLEALSRGASRCTFVDSSPQSTAIVTQNAHALGLFARARVATMEARSFLAQSKDKYDIIFLDPPYHTGLLPDLLQQVAAVTAPGGVVLCESDAGPVFPSEASGLVLKKRYRYGIVHLTRYQMPLE